jgi:hypothetical protein
MGKLAWLGRPLAQADKEPGYGERRELSDVSRLKSGKHAGERAIDNNPRLRINEHTPRPAIIMPGMKPGTSVPIEVATRGRIKPNPQPRPTLTSMLAKGRKKIVPDKTTTFPVRKDDN